VPVAAAGQRVAQPYETWIAAHPSRGGVRVLITGPRGFERTVAFARDEAPKRIARPAARPSIAAAQGIRRAARKAKAAAATTAPAKAARKKRRLSPEGRARIIAATKRQWAALREGKAKAKAAGKSAVRGLKRAAQRVAAKKSKSAVGPRRAAVRAKAAPRRPAAGRAQGGQAAAPAMAEAAAVGRPRGGYDARKEKRERQTRRTGPLGEEKDGLGLIVAR
jgi:hypothetical protein